MDLFRIFYELGVVSSLLAILAASEIAAVYLQRWAEKPWRQGSRK